MPAHVPEFAIFLTMFVLFFAWLPVWAQEDEQSISPLASSLRGSSSEEREKEEDTKKPLSLFNLVFPKGNATELQETSGKIVERDSQNLDIKLTSLVDFTTASQNALIFDGLQDFTLTTSKLSFTRSRYDPVNNYNFFDLAFNNTVFDLDYKLAPLTAAYKEAAAEEAEENNPDQKFEAGTDALNRVFNKEDYYEKLENTPENPLADKLHVNSTGNYTQSMAQVLRSSSKAADEDVSLGDMEALRPFFERLFVPSTHDTQIDFPIPSSKYQSAPPCQPVGGVDGRIPSTPPPGFPPAPQHHSMSLVNPNSRITPGEDEHCQIRRLLGKALVSPLSPDLSNFLCTFVVHFSNRLQCEESNKAQSDVPGQFLHGGTPNVSASLPPGDQGRAPVSVSSLSKSDADAPPASLSPSPRGPLGAVAELSVILEAPPPVRDRPAGKTPKV
uniref:Uncharacterized protein n=1 Tax=Chromera velia CCMP2878 TaxID=1169474 RepID=A0A0G4G0T4_9ALVE|eukprot:Cvel_3992.t1-p1 / transcript=Cvel_3992.t1 / gene=Cvel_3992 / organism=Chromera_velia_CCMP2878 / gene_product=hypothetical protein / transcript_product=hypothetical protein / location=Cvel_scaffold169:104724-111774(+) / protein_length=442 / sequence_SO=supercontig / SO=protein_coding / is_pseudo=false